MSSIVDSKYEEKIADRTNRRIHMPEELVEEIIMWCDRKELGEHVSLVSLRFLRISHPFIHREKQHGLPNLVIHGGENKWMEIKYGNGLVKELSRSEVPNVQVPENIIVEKSSVEILGIDEYVIQFMQLIEPIFTGGICLLVEISKDNASDMEMVDSMIELAELFSGKIQGLFTDIELCEGCAFLLEDSIYLRKLNEPTEEELNIVKNWLYQPREDDKAKWFGCGPDAWNSALREFVKTIKEEFQSAEQPVKFIILIDGDLDEDLSQREVNLTTGERLTVLRCVTNDIEPVWLIVRMPQRYSRSERANQANDLLESIERVPSVRIKPMKKSKGWQCSIM